TQRVDQLTQRMDELTQRVDQLTQRMDELTQRVDQLTQRMDELTQRVNWLTERVDQIATDLSQLTQRVDALTQRVDQLSVIVEKLTRVQERMANDVAKMKEYYLEQKYYTRAHAYFSKLIRRIRALRGDEISAWIADLEDKGVLTSEEAGDLPLADVIVRGRRQEDGQEVYLVVEVSWGIGQSDIRRAARRAQTLAKAGVVTIPLVAGEGIAPEAHELARELGVKVILDGSVDEESAIV
ncbi:MAG: hypothetical protein ACUVTY_12750, partial [Armatimonadota bacterium]